MGQMQDRSSGGDPRPSVYNRALWEAPKPYPFGEEGWAFMETDPKLDTPEKRKGAVSNILNNGSKVLILLTLDPSPDTWTHFKQVHSAVNALSGNETIKDPRVAQFHLVTSLEEIGAAAHGDPEDQEWRITPFGQAAKPIVMYLAQTCIDLNIDTSSVWGKITRRIPNQKPEKPQTTAEVRTAILSFLASNANKQTHMSELATICGVSSYSIGETLRSFRKLGWVAFDSVDTANVDTVTEYSYQEVESEQPWEPYIQTTPQIHRIHLAASAATQRALMTLTKRGIEKFGAKDILEELGTAKIRNRRVSYILKHFESLGYITLASNFKKDEFSNTKIAEAGQEVIDRIIDPLDNWAKNPSLAPQIEHTFEAYKTLVREIPGMYKPWRTDRGQSIDKIIKMVQAHEGQLYPRSIAEEMGVSSNFVDDVCNDLINKGALIKKSPKEGQRPTLWINPDYLAKIEPETSSQRAG